MVPVPAYYDRVSYGDFQKKASDFDEIHYGMARRQHYYISQK